MLEKIELLARLAEEKKNLQDRLDASSNGQERLLLLAQVEEIDWFIDVVNGVYL